MWIHILTTMAYVEVAVSNTLQLLDVGSLQNIVLGVLAIYIPFYIAVYEHFNNKTNGYPEFIRETVESNIFQIKEVFVLSLVLLFIMSFNYPVLLKLVLLGVLTYAIRRYWNIFIKMYHSVKQRDFTDEVSSMLKNLNFSDDKMKNEMVFRIWESVWNKDLEYNEERDYSKIFIEFINKLLKDKKYEEAKVLIQSYQKQIPRRYVILLQTQLTEKVLDWTYTIFKINEEVNEKIHAKEEYAQDWLLFDHRFLQSKFLHSLWGHLLEKDEHHFVIQLKKFLDEKDDSKFTHTIVTELFYVIEKNYTHLRLSDFWHYFPPEWTVQSNNFKKLVPQQFLRLYLDLCIKKFTTSYKDNDEDPGAILNIITPKLFPQIEPTIFSKYLFILLMGRDPSCPMKYIIEQKWIFGNVSRIYMGDAGTTDEKMQSCENTTYKFINQVFQPDQEELNSYLKELHQLSEDKEFNEKYDRRIFALTRLIENLLLPENRVEQ